MSGVEVRDLSTETWADFQALFGKHKGVRGGCWCTYFRCASAEFDNMTKESRRSFHEGLARDGRGHGILVYDAGCPLAWCQFGPPQAFPRIDRGRAYGKLELPAWERPQWRITCLFVDKQRRRQGLSVVALRAALARIEARGGGVVEAFPLDIAYTGQPPHTGSVALYAREGFQAVTRLGKNVLLMRRRV
ncbi:GNAT family N-acetyltransferase [Aquisalimonas sp. APHAB1-3]|uniref:GNAT family N-acetyltransferase n=1 Tax=unclassified Aquisalimonas TaxID=2644645 RepID=UPI0025C099DD|nr:GNAT family N-acetyltransferase [Aquisalimonas sp.]